MDPRLRTSLAIVASAILAVWLGAKIAEEAYFWPTLAAATAVAAVLVRILHLPLDVIIVGWLVIGYIVGNRGFAQLMPAPGLPLLPAEAGLLIAGGWRLVNCAFSRRLPFVFDALNWAILLWLVAGGARLIFDILPYKFTAIRDSAMVYYALFFFIAQDLARDAVNARYLKACAATALLLVIPVYALSEQFPSFFQSRLTIHGVPLILHKGDLVHTYFAMGAVLLFHFAGGLWRYWAWLLVAMLFAVVAGGDSRAALAGLMCAVLLHGLARRFQFAALIAAVSVAGFVTLLSLATVADNAWADQKLTAVGDRLRSLTDVRGLSAYSSDANLYKGDNNRFRLVWWKNVVEQTWAEGPVFGVGFGADLAGGFLQDYYPEGGEEFSARSPHNIFLTVFGRMGGVGLAVWLVLVLQLARHGWHCLRRQEDPVGWALWCSLAVMLVSATFGVVLEGPMGAVPFWILAGIANARWHAHAETAAAPVPIAASPAPALTSTPAPAAQP